MSNKIITTKLSEKTFIGSKLVVDQHINTKNKLLNLIKTGIYRLSTITDIELFIDLETDLNVNIQECYITDIKGFSNTDKPLVRKIIGSQSFEFEITGLLDKIPEINRKKINTYECVLTKVREVK